MGRAWENCYIGKSILKRPNFMGVEMSLKL